MQDYLFGYGSLICTVSRDRDAHSCKAIPVRVKGLQRCWNYHNPSRKRNALGVVVKEGASCNGVIFAVDDFSSLNKREQGYDLVEIKASEIEVISGELPLGKFWVYIPKESILPTVSSPIQQSYLDVVMTGCLEYGEEFAVEFVRSTEWSLPWVNDRNEPNYSSYLKNTPIEKIDLILKKVIPEEFEERKDLYMLYTTRKL
ncbi:MAG: gamma-glutamylcyclotransferase [Nanoarchaeota archaeon]|nr:gamma-glutamylcyclotransferase [Nanoarchaeota archaeon]